MSMNAIGAVLVLRAVRNAVCLIGRHTHLAVPQCSPYVGRRVGRVSRHIALCNECVRTYSQCDGYIP